MLKSSYWQIKWQIYPPYWHLVVKNGDFTFLLLELILADQVADLPPQYWHLVVKNGNFTLLLLELILADQVADLPPVVASSGQEWQFHIATVKSSYWQIKWKIYPPYWHLVVKNGDFTLLLLELILADQVADLLSDLPPSPGS